MNTPETKFQNEFKIDEKSEIYKIWKSWISVKEMLFDRGYGNIDDYWTCDIFMQNYSMFEDIRTKLELLYSRDEEYVRVIWISNVDIADIKNIYSTMKKEAVNHYIIVCVKITKAAQTAIRDLKSLRCYVEVFTEDELQYNRTRHNLVPQHILLTKDERDAVLKKWNITKNQVPEIKYSDPISRYFGASIWDMFKIVRESDNIDGSYSVTYRIVTP